MSQDILDTIFNRIKIELEKGGIFTESTYKAINYGIQFTLSNGSLEAVLRVYANSKGKVKIDYSQIKDKTFSLSVERVVEESMKDIYSNYSSNSSLGSLVNDPTNEYNLGYPIIGNDESGKGDFFGSLVVASVYLDQKAGNLLAKNGIQDSKNLTDKKILTLESTIKKYCYGKFSIVEITPERYNQLYDKFKNEGKNLNMLLAWAHARSLENLLNKVDCKRAIIDKFSGEDLVVGYLQEKGRSIDIIQKYKAENNIAVAAASILARAQFVKRISMLEEEYGVKLYKGASAKVISSAKEFVKKHSRKDLKNIAKLHFKTYEKI